MSSPASVSKKITSIPLTIKNSKDNEVRAAPAVENKSSPGMALLSRALVNVEQVLSKNEETLAAVREQVTKLTNQRIGLLSQKHMLVELKTQLEQDEVSTEKEIELT